MTIKRLKYVHVWYESFIFWCPFILALDRRNSRCTEVTVNASLKSEVFLPCHFNISRYNETVEVNWSHYSSLVTIMINGRIFFESPTEGRVKVYPLLSKHGNFSILIRDLQSSDIGTYTCELKSECWRVKINEHVKSNGPPHSKIRGLIVTSAIYITALAYIQLKVNVNNILVTRYNKVH